MSVANSKDEETKELGISKDPDSPQLHESDIPMDLDVQVEHFFDGVLGECNEFLNESKDGDEIAMDGILGDMSVSAIGESQLASPRLQDADETIFDEKPMFLQDMPTLGVNDATAPSAETGAVSATQSPPDESLDSKPAAKAKGRTTSSFARASTNVPILPRYSEPSTPSIIYELPKRGKGTGKKRGEYKKRYRESFTSCHDSLKSKPSETFVQGKTNPIEPTFVEREVFVSLDPDPLLQASPKSSRALTEESEPFPEYELDVSPQVLQDTGKKVSANIKKVLLLWCVSLYVD